MEQVDKSDCFQESSYNTQNGGIGSFLGSKSIFKLFLKLYLLAVIKERVKVILWLF